MTADTTPDAAPVPLRQRSIPDQLDYLGDKLAAQMDTQTVPRDALIAMGAAVVGMGHIAMVLRKQAAPLDDAAFGDLRAFCTTWLAELAQHGWLSRRLLLADGSELDVGRLSAALDEVEKLEAERDWQPGRWRQVRRPDGSLWMETSDGDEAEAEARKQGWPLYRLWECRETEWRPEGGDRG